MFEKITLHQIAKSIMPSWGEINDWFNWPPDTFALISTVLIRTGGYKVCLTDNGIGVPWDRNDWQTSVEKDAEIWTDFSSNILVRKGKRKSRNLIPDFKFSKSYFEIIEAGWNEIDVNDLRIIDDTNIHNNKKAKEFLIALIVILAVADTCGRGLGTIGQNVKAEKERLKLFHAVANLLLNNKGSLSVIPKFMGIVLPKMRTPQSGLVIRGLSLYLTFHISEVEVMWRTFPWLNNHKQRLNILAVPYPKRVDEDLFITMDDINHHTNYFQIKAIEKGNNIKVSKNSNEEEAEHGEDFLNRLVAYVYKESKTNHGVDVLVFPELGLSVSEHNFLLKKLGGYLASDGNVEQLPIVVAGVLNDVAFSSKNENGVLNRVNNELRVSVFFAGKWYNLIQNKHHRWLLDRNQIIQYGLESVLSTEKNWFEYISVCQRSLAILAPNGWLAMTALICEDLARQEPIGDLIRGIGPTLLLALLSDGPQIKNRWSARYASGLADDPGTAVLSLTSFGMASRSIKYEHQENSTDINDECVVGLWKDMIRGWKELSLNKGKDALRFTISATMIEEITLDRRTDHKNASVFRMDSVKIVQEKFEEVPQNFGGDGYELLEGNWDDIRDLSALLFAFDSIIDILSVRSYGDKSKEVIDYIISLFPISFPPQDVNTYTNNRITLQIIEAWEHPEKLGISSAKKPESTDFEVGIKDAKEHLVDKIVSNINEFGIKNLINYYQLIIDLCDNRLKCILKERKGDVRKIQVPYVVCIFIINAKVSNWKSRKDLASEMDVEWQDVLILKNKIKNIIRNSLPSINGVSSLANLFMTDINK